MIVGKSLEVGINAEQLWSDVDHHAGFLMQFAPECLFDSFVLLDTAAGEMPTRSIGVADQQKAAFGIDHSALCAKRQAAREAPVVLQAAGHDACERHLGLLEMVELVCGRERGLARPGCRRVWKGATFAAKKG